MGITKVSQLPTIQYFWPIIHANASINICVKDLWWPYIKVWNEVMVRSIFIEEDVEKGH